MNCRLLCLSALALLAGTVRAQEAKLDARSQELIAQADAALAKAKTISLVQRRRVLIVQGDKEQEAGGEETSVLAARPGLFRVTQEGDSAEFTVSTGGEWIRYVASLNAYQKTDVSTFAPAELFRAPNPRALAATGRGLVSLWLGGHSLAALLAGAETCTYAGTQTVDGAELHRLDAKLDRFQVALLLTSGQPPLLRQLIVAQDLPTPAGQGQNRALFRVDFRDWGLDAAVPADAFVFVPPQGATPVDSIDQAVSARTATMEEKAPPGQPFPAGPEAIVSTTYKASMKRAYVDALRRQYEAHGDHNPKWDAAVLELQARWADRLFGDHSLALMVDLRERAYYLQSVGCQDPLVKYWLANLTQYLDDDATAAPLLQAAWEALRDSPYSASAKLPSLRRYLQQVKGSRGKETELIRQLEDQWVALFTQALAEPDLANGNQRLACYLGNSDWDDMPLALREKVIAKLAALPEADPWLRAYYTGRYEIAAAWRARGGGYANTVDQEGWKGFAEHLTAANRELTTAWKLHPELPEAPTEMITVAMGGHAAESVRVWFDRAIAGQLDWGHAYDKLRWAYRPRWGGSTTWTYELGLEAAKTGRFDSYAPHHFWLSLLDLRAEDESWPEIMARPGAWETLMEVCEAYAAKSDPEYPAEHWRTVQVIGCWGAGKGEDALAVLRRLSLQPDMGVCARAGVDPDQLVAEVLLIAGPQAAADQRALRLLENEEFATAVPTLRQVMLAMRETEPKVYAYLGDRLCDVPLAAAPEVADTVLDAIIDMHRREVLVQSFIRWMAASPDDVPTAFQDRVAAYLGPICWTLMQQAPIDSNLSDEEIDARLAQVDAITLADIPGADALPAEETKEIFASEKILAKLRLHYCRQLSGDNQMTASWRYCRAQVVPLIKPIPRRGLLLDFVTEHQKTSRHRYHRAIQVGVKTWIQAQGMSEWDEQSHSLQPLLDTFGAMANPEERSVAAWELFGKQGGMRFAFLLKERLTAAKDALDAAVMERHLVSYLNSLNVPYRDAFATSVQTLAYNSVPGYESRVIGNAKLHHDRQNESGETRVNEADAQSRLGDLDAAISALVEYRKSKPAGEWLYVAGDRYHGSDECLKALLRAIAQHPNATPETLDLLERLFPDRMAEVQAQ